IIFFQLPTVFQLFGLVLVMEMTPMIHGSPTSSSLSAQLLRTREQCGAPLTTEQRLRLDKMQFEDVPSVQQFLHCFWSRLGLWQDNTGFQAELIVQRFGGAERINVEQAVPAINTCCARTKKFRKLYGATGWCYRCFICVLSTPVGGWYRRHMSDVINGNA
ncbi:hypothetical protein KR009_004558, partial [Drosophila setifemur]